MRLATTAATVVTLTAMALAPAAHADPPPAAGPSASASDVGAPLALRPDKPLQLAHEPVHSTLGWQLGGVLVVFGAAVVYFRRRSGAKPTRDTQLTILRRTPIGLRSELLVVNVEGQRFLLGVTPHSIQSIAVLDSEPPQEQPDNLGDRFAGIIDAAERSMNPNPLRGRAGPAVGAGSLALPEVDADAEQAKGLRALRRGP